MPLPTCYRKLVVNKLSSNFKEAVTIQSTSLILPSRRMVLIKNRYVGVNAADISVTSGRFNQDAPFGIGYEGVGDVVAIGDEVKDVEVGQYVAYWTVNLSAYGEYTCVTEEETFNVPEIKAKFAALPVSGLVAAIGLDKCAKVVDGETVLITAAAGGLGHIAVQWAKAAGCHVIAMCSTEAKVDILKELECDRIINYKIEDLDSVLSKEYPKGVDVIWDTMGGKFLETSLKHIATKGRFLIVGGITGYRTGEGIPTVDVPNFPELLLSKSAGILGFSLSEFGEYCQSYFSYLLERSVYDELRIILDDGQKSIGHEFVGLNGVIEAVEHLHSGNSIGKVIVKMN